MLFGGRGINAPCYCRAEYPFRVPYTDPATQSTPLFKCCTWHTAYSDLPGERETGTMAPLNDHLPGLSPSTRRRSSLTHSFLPPGAPCFGLCVCIRPHKLRNLTPWKTITTASESSTSLRRRDSPRPCPSLPHLTVAAVPRCAHH